MPIKPGDYVNVRQCGRAFVEAIEGHTLFVRFDPNEGIRSRLYNVDETDAEPIDPNNWPSTR